MSFIDTMRERQAEAALEHLEQSQQQHRRAKELLVGTQLGAGRIGELYPLSEPGEGETYIAQVLNCSSFGTVWAAVVDGRKPVEYQDSLDAALLHVVAIRNDGRTSGAHHYARRVLNMPAPK
jgi:hypothetical protein